MTATKKRRTRNRTSPAPTEYLVRNFLRAGESEFTANPERFVAELSAPLKADELAFNNFINWTVRSPATYRAAVEEIANHARRPVPINSLAPVLEERALLRGRVYLGHVWEVVDDLTQNWERMFWWLSEEGLSIEILTPRQLRCRINLKALTPFERLGGRLFREAMVQNRVSEEALLSIASHLDAKGFELKANLRPADWEHIAVYNQHHARRAIRTFQQAIRCFPREVRRGLSEAKRRYEKACEV
ncbi:MAG: hypothetical protein WAN69_14070 [Candidatus Korobacteraceae bacterium]